MSAYVVKKEVVLNADPLQVWDALTNPEKTKKYFFNAEVISDWKDGSSITFKGRMFWLIPFEMQGKIIHAEPGRFLQYTLENKSEERGGISVVTDELFAQNGKTVLSITDDVGGEEGAEKRFSRSEKGWDKVLKGLQRFINEKK